MNGVIWCRVSSEEQRSGFSLDAQEHMLTAFARQRSIDVVKVFRVAESATTATKRREFLAMLAYIEKEGINALVVEKVDRLTRNVADFARVDAMMKKGLTVSFAREGTQLDEASDPSAHLTFGIMAMVASFFAANLGREAKKGMNEKAAQGGLPFCCPVGYEPVPDPDDANRRSVRVDPRRGPMVAEMFRLAATGKYSLSELVTEMNRKGLTMRPSLNWPKAGRGTRPMTLPTVHKTLGNPFYHGVVRFLGKDYAGHHETLITRKTFNQVQAALHKRCTYRKPTTKKAFAFKGLAVCGADKCWRPLLATEQMGGHHSGPYRYYTCRRPGCSNRAVFKEGAIARLVESELASLAITDELAQRIKDHLKSAATDQSASEKAALVRLQTDESKRRAALLTLYDDRLSGLIDATTYQAKAIEIEASLSAIQQERQRLNQRNTHFRDEGSLLIDLLRGVKEQYQRASPERRAAILAVLIDKVVCRPAESYVSWRPVFAMLMDLNRVSDKKLRGE